MGLPVIVIVGQCHVKPLARAFGSNIGEYKIFAFTRHTKIPKEIISDLGMEEAIPSQPSCGAAMQGAMVMSLLPFGLFGLVSLDITGAWLAGLVVTIAALIAATVYFLSRLRN